MFDFFRMFSFILDGIGYVALVYVIKGSNFVLLLSRFGNLSISSIFFLYFLWFL